MYSVFGPGKAFKGWGFIDFDFTNDIVSEQDVLKTTALRMKTMRIKKMDRTMNRIAR